MNCALVTLTCNTEVTAEGKKNHRKVGKKVDYLSAGREESTTSSTFPINWKGNLPFPALTQAQSAVCARFSACTQSRDPCMP